MADVILSPIVDLIIETLGSAAVQEIKSLYGARDELSKLEETLETIRAVLVDAEKRQIREEQVKVWLQKLEDVLNAADDLVDEVNTEGLRRQLMPGKKIRKKVRTFFSSNNQLVFRRKMAREIKTIRERLDAISADKDGFHFVALETDQATRVRDDSHSFVDKENVVGRDKDRRAIVELLLDHGNRAQQEKVSVIPIVGMGGLGKTTLAQLVFNDERVQQHFDLKLWVCVSDDFSLKVLCEKIIKIITAERVENLEVEQLQTKLREQINGKRFLLVLDDVWNEDPGKWQGFKGLLRANCAEGSKIIVTARNDVVADIMGTVEPYYLGILDSEDSWRLFKKMAFEHRKELTNPNTVETAKKIVEKCGGLPLAISMIGSTLLRSRNPEIYWPSFLENDLLNITQKEKGILSTLKLSYDYLPTHLKPCFAYCSLFPKDHEFDVQTLVTMWIAQGFIRSPNQNQNLEDVGYDLYFMDLVSRSFFQEAKIDELKMVTTCKMHDLVHDLATEVAGDKYAMLGSYKDNISRKAVHVSFNVATCENLGVPPSSWRQAKRLRSFLSQSEYNLEFEGDHATLFLEHFRYLRMLRLDFSNMEKVPDTIGKLKHLRYLDISGTRIVRLPTCITKLVNLQKLNLNYCYDLRELPIEIHKLVNLKHLELKSCDSITHMPRGLGRLTKLQTLSLFLLSENIPSSTTYNHGKLDELMGLNNLRGELTIKGIRSGMETTVAKLREKKHLRSLYLDFKSRDDDASSSEQEWETTLEGLKPHTNLKELTLSNYCGATLSPLLPLPNLVTLSVHDSSKGLQLSSLDRFHSLKEIELVRLKALEYITINEGDYNFSTSSSPSISVLPSLQKLTLRELPNLRGWWWSDMVENQVDQVVFPSFPRLSSLEIEGCPKLTSMPCYPNVGDLTLRETSWKHFEQTMLVRDPQAQISATTAAEQASPPSAASSSITCSNIVSSYPLSKLTSLSPNSVTDLEYFPNERMKGLASLKRLDIWDCPALKYLSPWILYLTSLEELEIYSCEELEGIKWPETPTLTRLRVLKLDKLPKLKYVFAPDIQCLTSLEELEIYNCEGLEESKLTPTLTRLRVLKLCWLPKLKYVFAPDIQCLTSLEELEIIDCEGLEEIKLTPALPRLRVLNLRELPKLKYVFAPDIQCLTSLEELEIYSCEGLEEIKLTPALPRLRVLKLIKLPKLKDVFAPDIQCLTSLEELEIHRCDGLEEIKLPPALPRLRVLKLIKLPKLKYVFAPDIQCLTSLEELEIYSCEGLEEIKLTPALPRLRVLNLCELPKLKYVFAPDIQCLTSLEELEIIDCEGLEEIKLTPALPRLRVLNLCELPKLKYVFAPDIQCLTSLEELEIESCEGLEEIKLTPALPRLRVLRLFKLPKLKHLSSPGVQQHLTSLEELVIIECEELQVSNDDSIEWQALTTLRSLDFVRLPQLVSLPGGLQFLTTLKELRIWICANFTGLPDWICKLSSLETLDIDECPKFKSVPASISSLISLQKLEINGKDMNPREVHEDLDLSCSASATGDLDTSTASATGDLDTSTASGTGPSSWKILNKFRGLQLCNK